MDTGIVRLVTLSLVRKGERPITGIPSGHQTPVRACGKGPSFPRGNDAHWRSSKFAHYLSTLDRSFRAVAASSSTRCYLEILPNTRNSKWARLLMRQPLLPMEMSPN